jgi:uncharacterized protein (DUF697 family)
VAKVRIGGPKEFWTRLKSISVKDVQKEACRPLCVAVVGEESKRQAVIQLLSPANVNRRDVGSAAAMVTEYLSTAAEDGFPREGAFDLIIDCGNGRSATSSCGPVYSIDDFGGWEHTIQRIVEDQHDLLLPLARCFPVFRPAATAEIIQQTAMTNAEFSLITGVVSAFPIFEVILPANALSDIVVLTKNQVMMVLRLAAANGLEINYKSRMKELVPILLNAFGWRSVAREIVGAVPAVGFIFRAMISYAGTVAVGRAVQVYYQTGETVTRSQAQRLYREAYASSKDRVRGLAEKVRFKTKKTAADGSAAEEEPRDLEL